MNVDELRTGLREPAPVPLAVDLDRVVARGRRRQVARRAALPVAVVATAAAITIPAVISTNRPAQVETAGPLRTTAAATAATTPPAAPTTAAPTRIPAPTMPPAPEALIRTGERIAGGTRAFGFQPLPGPRYELRMAALSAADEIAVRHVARPPVSPADPPGFHAVSYAGSLPGGDWVVYGAYAGPVARVTAVLGGRPATARLVVLPGEPNLVVFWFSPGTGAARPGSAAAVTGLRAYDTALRPLPAGDPTVHPG